MNWLVNELDHNICVCVGPCQTRWTHHQTWSTTGHLASEITKYVPIAVSDMVSDLTFKKRDAASEQPTKNDVPF